VPAHQISATIELIRHPDALDLRGLHHRRIRHLWADCQGFRLEGGRLAGRRERLGVDGVQILWRPFQGGDACTGGERQRGQQEEAKT
jgi:hypothetical protein